MRPSRIAIIKDAPPPPTRSELGRPRKYPFLEMEIGDAFDVPNDVGVDTLSRYPAYQRVIGASQNATKESHGVRKFVVRIIDDEKIVRCWRVA